MLKLLPWRRSTLQTLTLNLNISLTNPPSPSLCIISRSQSFSNSSDIYDPPFSRTSSNTQNSENHSQKQKKKKKNKNQPQHSLESGKTANFPVNSDLPFDFSYSYSEVNPSVEPIGFREPKRFSPFGPGRLDRKWTGTSAPVEQPMDLTKLEEQRKAILGESLSEEETEELVERFRHSDCSRQINVGKGGVTHNMLDDIHNHWKIAEAVRIKCLGVPTIDMDNVCFHLEDKSGGKIIYRQINIILLYRGRNYDPNSRPSIPLMLWKPYAPIYPKLVKKIAEGLSFEETKEMINKGIHSPPLMKLNQSVQICDARNGVYVNVVQKVREAFFEREEDVVRLDCTHVGTSDCKRIGVKLRDLVPCVPILCKEEQLILWSGMKKHEDKLVDSTCRCQFNL